MHPPRESLAAATIGRATAFRVAAWVTLIGLLVAAGSSLAGLVRTDRPRRAEPRATPAAIVLAMHPVGPRLALEGVCVLAVRASSAVALIALAAVVAMLQAVDAAVGAVQGNAKMAVPPVPLGMAQGYAIVLLGLARAPRGTAGAS